MECYYIYAIEKCVDGDWGIGALAVSSPGHFVRAFTDSENGSESDLRVRRITNLLEFAEAMKHVDLVMSETFTGQPVEFDQGKITLIPK